MKNMFTAISVLIFLSLSKTSVAATLVYTEELLGDLSFGQRLALGIDGVEGHSSGNSFDAPLGFWDNESFTFQGLTAGVHIFEYEFIATELFEGATIYDPQWPDNWVGAFFVDPDSYFEYVPYFQFFSVGDSVSGIFEATVAADGTIDFHLGTEGSGSLSYSIGLSTPGQERVLYTPVPSAFIFFSSALFITSLGYRSKKRRFFDRN